MTDLPPLTLLEEFLLLAQGAQAGTFALPAAALDTATAGAVLMDLLLRRRLDCDLRNLFVNDPLPVDDPLLDPVLQVLALAPVLTPQPIAGWLQRLSGEAPALRAQAVRRLAARGGLSAGDSGKTRLLTIILSEAIPQPRDIMLVALAAGCGLFAVWLTPDQQIDRAPRIAQLTRMDLIGQALARAIAAQNKGQ